jgi:RNase H-fold protein (predicted Holliday junction resolvase)
LAKIEEEKETEEKFHDERKTTKKFNSYRERANGNEN